MYMYMYMCICTYAHIYTYIYIHIYIYIKTFGTISMKPAESGAGEEFPLLFCRAEARAKGVVFFTDTGRTASVVALGT